MYLKRYVPDITLAGSASGSCKLHDALLGRHRHIRPLRLAVEFGGGRGLE